MRIYYILLISLLTACGSDKAQDQSSDKKEAEQNLPEGEMSLVELDPKTTNVNFQNLLTETEDLNYFSFEYMYNGGGVAIGDINNDGLPDIYFTGNQVPDKLYLNKGNMQFEDITKTALGQSLNGWNNGVVMADVNADGLLDIYVCRGGNASFNGRKHNLLYINQGNLTFKEEAAIFGLADSLSSTQATFFDADKDGDLDAYIVNVPEHFNGNEILLEDIRQIFLKGENESDHFYRNNNGHFDEESMAVGINNHSFGLGLSTGDLNSDGLTDIYVSNDYFVRDYIFYNTGQKFFEMCTKVTKHISNFGMGSDIADFNNDGYNDIMVLDMAFSDHVRSKENMASMSPEKFNQMQKIGEHKQYMSNSLQLNAGNGTFSEIALFAGVAKTDWSWSPLFADLDNDGWKDLIVTNGYKRDIGNRDFQSKADAASKQGANNLSLLDLVPTSKVANVIYQNSKTKRFKDVSEAWGFAKAVNSNGMAYGDLDGDGDLDLVVNNMDEIASIYENTASLNYIQIVPKGPNANPFGIGVKCKITQGSASQWYELSNARGYLSSSEPIIHFGLGNSGDEVNIELTWPDGKINNLSTSINKRISVDHKDAKFITPEIQDPPLFANSEIMEIRFDHLQMPYDDYKTEILLPHSQARFGPAMCAGDVNGDGQDDLYICGGAGQNGILYLNKNGKLTPSGFTTQNSKRNEQGAHFFDVDGDSDLDLYIAIGGPKEHADLTMMYEDQLYINDGQGNFNLSQTFSETKTSSTSVIRSADYDKDGDLDLFVGGRTVHGKYPQNPHSFIFKNENGKLILDEKAFEARNLLGMVTGAEFSDYDSDGDIDIIIVGELMTITVMNNENGVFTKEDIPSLAFTGGFWQHLRKADIDGDGDEDFLLGNLGENNKFQPSQEQPLNVYANDFDGNGSLDIVLSKQKGDKHYPVRGKECSSQQMPIISQKFPSYSSFAHAQMEDIYTPEKLNEADIHHVHTMSSYIMWNNNGQFELQKLDVDAQIGPITSSAIIDLNSDGKLDLLLSGNYYDTEPETVAYDGSYGCVLVNNGEQSFTSLPQNQTKWFAPWNVKSMVTVNSNGTSHFIFGVNGEKVKTLKLNKL